MSNGVFIPIVCQAEDCKRKIPVPFAKHGYYAFYFKRSEFDKQRMRITRSEEGIEKESIVVACPLCGEETMVFVMKKASAIRFHKVSPEIAMVRPGDMFLPGEENAAQASTGSPLPSMPEFLDVEEPYRLEKVYSELIDEINTCYEYEAYSSALVMLRKLIENLLVDILRFKYDPLGKPDLYFDDEKKQFLPLSMLVANLEAIAPDYLRYGLTRDHIGVIKGLRKDGNVSAHSIVDLVDKNKMESLKRNANQAVVVLLRVLGIIKGLLDSEGNLTKKRRM